MRRPPEETTSFFWWEDDTLVINVLGTPGASCDAIGEPKGTQLRVSVTEAPRRGRATDHMVHFLAEEFGVLPSAIEVVFGRYSVNKQLRVKAPTKIPAVFQQPTRGTRRFEKQDLMNAVAEASGLTKADAAKAVDGVFDAITAALKAGDDVRLIGFGSFGVTERAARDGKNPRTGEKIAIPASKAPKFSAGAGLKAAVNG